MKNNAVMRAFLFAAYMLGMALILVLSIVIGGLLAHALMLVGLPVYGAIPVGFGVGFFVCVFTMHLWVGFMVGKSMKY